jgi:O-antigen/teichoic acid export membrane protein
MQGRRSGRRSAARSGLLTGISTAAVSASAALAGAILSRKFGHGVKTDGFFAAYAVYVAVVLVASALRVVVLPEFARARAAGALGRETGSWALALAIPLVPLVAVAVAAPHWAAGLLTSSPAAQSSAAQLLPWLVPAAAAQVYAGVGASALAALDDYGTAALAYALGAVAGLAVIGALVHRGVAAFGWGLAVNGAIAVGIPFAVLVSKGGVGRPARHVGHRLRILVEGVSLPFALQGLYIIGYRFASGLGTGRPTTFSYAYLIASLLVAVTATSIALVSSVPLSRGELTPERASGHVVASSWVSIAIVAAAAGVFALAGQPLVKAALGSSYGGGTGAELGRLVAYLSPWMVVSIALSVTFPLLFVRGRARWLPLLAIVALAVHVPVEWAGSSLWGLGGIAAGLALTTAGVLAVLLAALGVLRSASAGVAVAAVSCGIPALAGFGLASFLPEAIAAAALGLALYTAILGIWRPAGLVHAWGYLRRLA